MTQESDCGYFVPLVRSLCEHVIGNLDACSSLCALLSEWGESEILWEPGTMTYNSPNLYSYQQQLPVGGSPLHIWHWLILDLQDITEFRIY